MVTKLLAKYGYCWYAAAKIAFFEWKKNKNTPLGILFFYQKAYPIAIAGFEQIFHVKKTNNEHIRTINKLYKKFLKSTGKRKIRINRKINEHIIRDSKIVQQFLDKTSHLKENVYADYLSGFIQEEEGEIGYEELAESIAYG